MSYLPHKIDQNSGATSFLDEEHVEVHNGNSYSMKIYDTSMANTNYIGVSFTTPTAAVGLVHLSYRFSVSVAASVALIEGPTLAGGAAITSYNRNRGSSNTSSLTSVLQYDSTTGGHSITGGTTFMFEYMPGSAIGVFTQRSENEFLLAASTSYAIKLTALGAGAAYLHIGWYERPNPRTS